MASEVGALLFFRDGRRNGLRTAEIPSRSLMAVTFHRRELNNAKKSVAGFDKPGVYLLVGEQTGFKRRPSSADSKPTDLIARTDDEPTFFGIPVYVGEGQNVAQRLGTHAARGNGAQASEYEYWEQTVAFISKDDLLTRGHAMWLEKMLIALISKSKSAVPMNGKGASDQAGGLGEIDKAFCDHYFEDIRTLAFALGIRFLEDVSVVSAPEISPARVATSPEEAAAQAFAKDQASDSPIFTLTIGDPPRSHGTLYVTRDQNYVVKAGSWGPEQVISSLAPTYKNLRNILVSNESIAINRGRVTFTKDVSFDSIAAATQVLTGSTFNGRTVWNHNGRALGDWPWPA